MLGDTKAGEQISWWRFPERAHSGMIVVPKPGCDTLGRFEVLKDPSSLVPLVLKPESRECGLGAKVSELTDLLFCSGNERVGRREVGGDSGRRAARARVLSGSKTLRPGLGWGAWGGTSARGAP